MKGTGKLSVLKDRGIRNFIILQILFNGLVSIVTLFLNTFIMKNFGSTSKDVLIYNLILAVVQPVAMMTSFVVIRMRSYLFTQRIGFVFYSLVLIILCIWGERVSSFYPLFGVLISFGAGYYFGIYSVQTIAYTTDENRDMVSGIASALCSIAALSLPLLAGILISTTNEFVGYRIVFGIAAFLALLAIFVTTRLPLIEKQKEYMPFSKVLKRIMKDKNGFMVMIANCFDNCRSFTISFYITILIFNLIQKELLVSVNATIGSCLAILGAVLYGVIVNNRNRTHSVFISLIIVLIPCVVMCFNLGVVTLMVFYALNSFCSSFLSTPVLNTHFKVMESFEDLKGMGAQIHTVREIFVCIGRVFGIVLILCLPQTNIGIVVLLSILESLSIINVLLISKIEKSFPAAGHELLSEHSNPN